MDHDFGDSLHIQGVIFLWMRHFGAVIDPLTNIKMKFLTTPLPDTAQEKLNRVIERFIDEKDSKQWTRKQLLQSIKKLEADLSAIIRR